MTTHNIAFVTDEINRIVCAEEKRRLYLNDTTYEKFLSCYGKYNGGWEQDYSPLEDGRSRRKIWKRFHKRFPASIIKLTLAPKNTSRGDSPDAGNTGYCGKRGWRLSVGELNVCCLSPRLDDWEVVEIANNIINAFELVDGCVHIPDCDIGAFGGLFWHPLGESALSIRTESSLE